MGWIDGERSVSDFWEWSLYELQTEILLEGLRLGGGGGVLKLHHHRCVCGIMTVGSSAVGYKRMKSSRAAFGQLFIEWRHYSNLSLICLLTLLSLLIHSLTPSLIRKRYSRFHLVVPTWRVL